MLVGCRYITDGADPLPRSLLVLHKSLIANLPMRITHMLHFVLTDYQTIVKSALPFTMTEHLFSVALASFATDFLQRVSFLAI